MLKKIFVYGGAIGLSSWGIYKLKSSAAVNEELIGRVRFLEEEKKSTEEKLDLSGSNLEQTNKKHLMMLKNKDNFIAEQKDQLQRYFEENRRLVNKIREINSKFELRHDEMMKKLTAIETTMLEERRNFQNEKKLWNESDPTKVQSVLNETHKKELESLRDKQKLAITKLRDDYEKEKSFLEKELKASRTTFLSFKESQEKNERELIRELRKELKDLRVKVKLHEQVVTDSIPQDRFEFVEEELRSMEKKKRSLEKLLEERDMKYREEENSRNQLISTLQSENVELSRKLEDSNEDETLKKKVEEMKLKMSEYEKEKLAYEDLKKKAKEMEKELGMLKIKAATSINIPSPSREDMNKKFEILDKKYKDLLVVVKSKKKENNDLRIKLMTPPPSPSEEKKYQSLVGKHRNLLNMYNKIKEGSSSPMKSSPEIDRMKKRIEEMKLKEEKTIEELRIVKGEREKAVSMFHKVKDIAKKQKQTIEKQKTPPISPNKSQDVQKYINAVKVLRAKLNEKNRQIEELKKK